jgi:3-oxoadipate enol-lactonase
MPFANLSGAQLFYQWDGRESAPVLVFSNSLGATHRMWDLQVQALSNDFRILRYDGRGHGQSSKTQGPYTIEQLAGDILQLFDFLKIEHAHFCGLSMGGMIGMLLDAKATNRFQKIVLCNTAAKIGTADTWSARITAVQQGGMKAVAGAVLDRWLTEGYRSSHPRETTEVLTMLENADPDGYIANCAAVRDADLGPQLGSVRIPALVITGSHDLSTPPADGRWLHEHIRGSKYVELPAAHLSNIEASDAFNRELSAFLQSQGAHG